MTVPQSWAERLHFNRLLLWQGFTLDVELPARASEDCSPTISLLSHFTSSPHLSTRVLQEYPRATLEQLVWMASALQVPRCNAKYSLNPQEQEREEPSLGLDMGDMGLLPDFTTPWEAHTVPPISQARDITLWFMILIPSSTSHADSTNEP